jgi:hypothetical protein
VGQDEEEKEHTVRFVILTVFDMKVPERVRRTSLLMQ